MPPRARDPTDPGEWLRRARSNLARASARPGSREILLEDLCFDAQQAAEKALKAVLVARGIDFPKIHSIGDLQTLLRNRGVRVPASLREAAILTDYAVEVRYPGFVEPVTPAEHRRAVVLARRVVAWAQKRVRSKR